MFRDNYNNKILFFFGAGASVPADISDVKGLVDDFKKWLKSHSRFEELKLVDRITMTIDDWLHQRNEIRDVDIELLLETIEKIENAEGEILLKFYNNDKFEFESQKFKKGADSLSNQIKEFIRTNCFVSEDKINYLVPLGEFLDFSDTLNIYSTNYDNSVEQFCDSNDIRYSDGFGSAGWNINVFNELRQGIRLYKLHGSITWWRTEEGDYRSLPLKQSEATITLSSGNYAVPVIIYPGKKLEYNEPIFDILSEFKNHLYAAKYVFIVGYAFKDDHIKRLYHYAGRKNRKLVIFLISPSCFEIYNRRLKFHKEEEFSKNYDSNFSGSSNTALLSKLQRRVICLPYKIQKVLPILKERYLVSLIEGERLDKEVKKQPECLLWKERLKHYINCEYMQKVEAILEKSSWDHLVSTDWMFSFEISIKGLLNSIPSEDDSCKAKWRNFFNQVVDPVLSPERITYIPTLGMTASIPSYIQLGIKTPNGIIDPNELTQFLERTIIPAIMEKLNLLDDREKYIHLYEFHNKLISFKSYLRLWLGSTMTFQRYHDMRRQRYPDQVATFRKTTDEFSTQQNEAGQHIVTESIRAIEQQELSLIYGGNAFNSM